MLHRLLALPILVLACTLAARADDAVCASATPYPTNGATTIDLTAPRATLHVQVVDTYATRERGLMCITSLPENAGMIFVFPTPGLLNFWMKDTRIPLDMVWVASDGVVTAVAAKVPRTKPGTPDREIAARQGEGRYVIELAAGAAARAGIKRGTKLALPPLSASD
jgi:uncharacterized membrane protein (UPF0127 family)